MKLLMHICCGPCAVYPLETLIPEGFDIEGLFYNPNIHPYDEFVKRRENVEKLAVMKNLHVTYEDDFKQQVWESFDGPGADRCLMCYGMRLDRAAHYAAENGFDAFTTSLLVSPYQKHDLIKELGEKYAKKHGIAFYYRDFRPGFREGQQKAKELGLYRQKYCGCIISLGEAQRLREAHKKSENS